MALDYIPLPLFSDPDYTYRCALENQSYIVRITWNERMERWFFNLYSDDNTPIFLGYMLSPDYPMMADYGIEGLNGFFYLIAKSSLDSDKFNESPRLLDQYYSLYYLYEE